MIEQIELQVSFTESLVRYATELTKKGSVGDVTQQYSVVHDKAVGLMRLDVIQRALRDMGSAEVNYTPSTTPTQSSDGTIGTFQTKNGRNRILMIWAYFMIVHNNYHLSGFIFCWFVL